MDRMILVLLVIMVGVLVQLDATIIQAVVWSGTAVASIALGRHLISCVYPGDPKPVTSDEIEDAVVVYAWSEALALNRVYLMALGFMLLASLIVI